MCWNKVCFEGVGFQPDILDGSSLRELADSVMKGIWEELDRQPPIVEASEFTNLGIAHGWAGFLYAALRWCRSSGTGVPQPAAECLEQLAELAEPIGCGARWKWMLDRPAPNSAYP